MTGRADYLALGDWNTVCFQCGRKRKASTMKKHWQGYYVCPEHWEPRQAQDFVRSVPDIQTPPWVQPMPADTFTDIPNPIVVEAAVATDDPFADGLFYGIATETSIPLSTE